MKKLAYKTLAIIIVFFIFGCNDDEITSPIGSGSYLLCYMKYTDQWDIYINNMEGSNPQNISNNPYEDSDPIASPDGRYIAYTKRGSNSINIAVYNIRNNLLTNITPASMYQASMPQWTPDSRKIVYTRHTIGDSNYYTYAINPDGNDDKEILDFAPKISFYNDSYNFLFEKIDYIIYRSNMDYNSQIYILDVKGIGKEYSSWQDFYPEENKLLLLIAEEPRITNILAEYDVNEGTLDTLSKAAANWQYILQPKYSPDYSKIAFIEVNYDEHIYILSLLENGKKTELVRLTDPSEWFDYGALSFSPDGKYLAYVKNISNSGEYVSWSSYLYIINISTKQATFIDSGKRPSWANK